MAKEPPRSEPGELPQPEPLYKTLLIAVAAHVALLSLSLVAKAPVAANTPAMDDAKGALFDIETLPEEPKAPAGEQPQAQAPPPDSERAKSIELPKSIPPGGRSSNIEANPSNSNPNVSAENTAPPGGEAGRPGAAGQEGGELPADSFSPPEGAPGNGGGQGGIITGLGGNPIWMVPGVMSAPPPPAPAPTHAPEAKATDSNIAGQVLGGALRKHDRELGLESSAGSVVASTLASVVRNSEAPPDARATFEIKLGPSGNVLGVRVVSSSAGNAGTWQGIAKRAAADLGSKSLGLGGTAAQGGATVTVKIESKVVYPAGSREKVDIQPVCAEEVIEEMVRTIAEGTAGEPSRGPINDPAVNRPDPSQGTRNSPEEEERKRRFCIPIGVMGKGDISNIGAHAQKVVRSTFTVNIPGQKMLEDVKEVDKRAPWSPADPNKVKPIRRKWKKKKKKPSN